MCLYNNVKVLLAFKTHVIYVQLRTVPDNKFQCAFHYLRMHRQIFRNVRNYI